MASHRRIGFLLHDIVLIGASIAVAVFLVRTDALGALLASAQDLELLGSFIAGLFFTSIFTTAPAIVALGGLALAHPLAQVALAGAAGATLGDFLIFRFIRDAFSVHILELVSHRHLGKRLGVLLHRRLFRWVSFFVGGLIIASPLPDELGIGLLGFSKMKTPWFIALSLTFNFIGILLIGVVARAL